MLNIANEPGKFFSHAEVDAIAASMNTPEDDWTYVADHGPEGSRYARIRIFDEEGEFVSML